MHYADRDEDFIDIILPLVDKLGKDIKNEWEISISNTPMLGSLSPSAINTIKNLRKNIHGEVSLNSNCVQNKTISSTSDMAIDDTINQVVAPIISAIVGVIVLYVVDLLITGGLAIIWSSMATFLTYIGLRSPKEINSPEDLNKKGQQLYSQLKANLWDILGKKEVKERLCFTDDGLMRIIKRDVDMYKSYYRDMLQTKEKEFEDNVRKADEKYSIVKEKLEEIAKKANKIRTEEVIPLRNKINSFISQFKQ